jgi:hypothetical protein
MCRVKSSTSAAPTVWPASAVPPPRGSTGTPCSAASRTAATTSSVSRGSTTPTGRIWYSDASVLYSSRDPASKRTSPRTRSRRARSRPAARGCTGARTGSVVVTVAGKTVEKADLGRMSAARPPRSIRVAAIRLPLRERSPAILPAGLRPSGHDRLRGLPCETRPHVRAAGCYYQPQPPTPEGRPAVREGGHGVVRAGGFNHLLGGRRRKIRPGVRAAIPAPSRAEPVPGGV